MKSKLLVCACSQCLATAGSRDSSGGRCSCCEESLLCSLAAVRFGAAGECSTAPMACCTVINSPAVLVCLKILSSVRSLNLRVEIHCFLNYFLIVSEILPVPRVKTKTLQLCLDTFRIKAINVNLLIVK